VLAEFDRPRRASKTEIPALERAFASNVFIFNYQGNSGAPFHAARGMSHLCSHGVQTLGVARSLGWKVHKRCANDYRDSTRSMRRCVYRQQLDLDAGCGALAKLPAITARVAPHGPSLRESKGDGGL
jgi:hypothetical protein